MDRRAFVGTLASTAWGLGCQDPLAAFQLQACLDRARPMRVRGRVLSGDVGLAGVPVTDGIRVVLTGTEGEFELISDSSRPYVYVSVPSGHRIPSNLFGAASFYQPLGLCLPSVGDDVSALFRLTPDPESTDRHTMLLLADPQMRDRSDVDRFAREALPELVSFARTRDGAETFAMVCGDLVFDDLDVFTAYETGMATIGLPFFQVPGNHDLDLGAGTNGEAKSEYTLRFGPPYYSFDRGDVHYVCLDNVYWESGGFQGFVDPGQLGWLASDLAHVEAGRTVVVVQHIPMLGTRHIRYGMEEPSPARSVVNRDQLYRLLEPYRVHVLAGHVHEAEHLLLGRLEEHQNGAVCGAFWTGPVCADGTPNGYVVYEAHGEELRWQFKASGLPTDRQMALYGLKSDPTIPTSVIANVWFWDPTWTVRWFEDGEPRGLMTRRMGLDPLARVLYGGEVRPFRYPFVDPRRTDHLFHATPSAGASEIVVEAEDRFGRVFHRRLRVDPGFSGGGGLEDPSGERELLRAIER